MPQWRQMTLAQTGHSMIQLHSPQTSRVQRVHFNGIASFLQTMHFVMLSLSCVERELYPEKRDAWSDWRVISRSGSG